LRNPAPKLALGVLVMGLAIFEIVPLAGPALALLGRPFIEEHLAGTRTGGCCRSSAGRIEFRGGRTDLGPHHILRTW
jgi:hypothetical protein